MRVARQAVCCALLGAFVISNPQCGAYRAEHAQLAQVYLRDGLYGQALAEIRRAIRQDGPDDRLFLIAALARLGLGEVDSALELIGQAIALHRTTTTCTGHCATFVRKKSFSPKPKTSSHACA